MIKEEISFLSSDNKNNIHAICCIPKNGQYTKILQIIHGMTEYIDKYIPFMEYLVSYGFIVVGHDQLGHGNSFTSSDDKGYFGEPDPDKLLIEDIHKLRLITQEKYKNIPYFMLGHSMGSYLLREYITYYSENLSGVILMSTGYVSPCICSLVLNFVKILACFKGWHHRSMFIKKLMEANGGGKYDPTGKDLTKNWLCRDPETVKILLTDKKSNFLFTLNGIYGLFECMKKSCDPSYLVKVKKDLPILFVSGDCDIVGECGKGIEKIFNLMTSVGSIDVTMKLFENDRHELLLELDKKDIYEYIRVWIEKKFLVNNSYNNKN